MAERYRFFDSIDGEDERTYTADEFAEYFRQFIRNGVFNGSGDNLKVEVDGNDMRSSVKVGLAWIEGYLYKIDTEKLYLQHESADSTEDRIDRVVVRLDKTLENRYVKAFVKTGEPSATPEPPALQRDNNIYEISLAKILVGADEATLKPENVTDERLDTNACGVVTHLFEQIDTTAIFNEWQTYVNSKKTEGNLEFDDYVAELQAKLTTFQQTWDDWVTDKISEPDGEFYAEWKVWFDELQDTTNLITKSQFDEFERKVEEDIAQSNILLWL